MDLNDWKSFMRLRRKHSSTLNNTKNQNTTVPQTGSIQTSQNYHPNASTPFTYRITTLLIFTTCLTTAAVLLTIYTINELTSFTCMHPLIRHNETIQYKPHAPVLIRNATIYDGRGSIFRNYDILLQDGRIKQLEKTGHISVTHDVRIFDVNGRVVTPGIVDVHSHLGIYSRPSTVGYGDGNEKTNPVRTPVRVMDAFRPQDMMVKETLKSGITTVLVVPGSGNVIGGEGMAVKLKGATVDEMIIKNQQRILKFACGENPKRAYGQLRGQEPSTRMGIAWVMRKSFEEARHLRDLQDAWDCNPANKYRDRRERPHSLRLESLVELLRGNAQIHVHCYEVVDIEMLIRLSKEFGFKIAGIHHALEAYKIPQILLENNISVITFADKWGFKMEGYDASVYGPKLLDEAGVSVVLKSDHPAFTSKYLVASAATAHHYGLSEQSALAAITSKAAEAIGLGHRIGTIAVGMDADITIWDRHFFLNGAQPYKVFIEGQLVVDNNVPAKSSELDSPKAKLIINGSSNSPSYVVTGVDVYTMTENDPLRNATIVVHNGMVKCLGYCEIPERVTHYHFPGGVAIPGIIESASPLGLLEVESESTTRDGVPKGTDLERANVKAVDGVNMYSRTLKYAYNSGVTSSITHPLGTTLINGISVAFHIVGEAFTSTIIKTKVALHVSIGTTARKKNSIDGSVSGQVAHLRALFKKAKLQKTTPENPFTEVLSGKLILAVHTHKADHIGHVLRLQKQFGFKMIIIGGAEAHLISDKISHQGVNVVLTPRKPSFYARWDILRTDAAYSIKKLYDAKVKLGLAIGHPHDARNLRWLAGYVMDSAAIPFNDALALITKNIGEIFELERVGRIRKYEPANFVLFDGNPFSYTSHVRLVALGNHTVCNPKQK